jgi:hypothetical protein
MERHGFGCAFLRRIAQKSAHDVTGTLQFNPVFAQGGYIFDSYVDVCIDSLLQSE